MNKEQPTNLRLSRSFGFTLIELLVVIAILSLLVSILMPSLSKANALSKSLACSSNLRSLGIAAALYTEENDGKLVPRMVGQVSPWQGDPRTYRAFLTESMGIERGVNSLMFKCPADESMNNDVQPGGSRYGKAHTRPRSYGINSLTASSLHGSGAIQDILRPQATIFLGDIGFPTPHEAAELDPEDWTTNIGIDSWGYMLMPNAWGGWISEYNIYPRHLRMVNVSFYDGHVRPAGVTEELQTLPHLYNNE